MKPFNVNQPTQEQLDAFAKVVNNKLAEVNIRFIEDMTVNLNYALQVLAGLGAYTLDAGNMTLESYLSQQEECLSASCNIVAKQLSNGHLVFSYDVRGLWDLFLGGKVYLRPVGNSFRFWVSFLARAFPGKTFIVRDEDTCYERAYRGRELPTNPEGDNVVGTTFRRFSELEDFYGIKHGGTYYNLPFYTEYLSDNDLMEFIKHIPDVVTTEYARVAQKRAEEVRVFHASVMKGWKGHTRLSLEYLREGKVRLAKRMSNYPVLVLESYGVRIQGDFPRKHHSDPMTADRLRRALDKIKIKDVGNFNNYRDFELILGIAKWATVLGEYAKDLPDYFLRHHDEARLTPMPERHRKWLSENPNALKWIFFQDLKVHWGNGPKKSVLEALAKLAGVDDSRAVEHLFNRPETYKALCYYERYQDDSVDTVIPVVKVERGNVVLEQLSKHSSLNLYIGAFSSCCQYIGGPGESVCTDSWSDPYSVNYVWRVDGDIKAHTWVFQQKDGSYVFDSVESQDGLSVELMADMLRELSAKLGTCYISNTNYGVTLQTRQHLAGHLGAESRIDTMGSYYYTDSDNGVYLINN